MPDHSAFQEIRERIAYRGTLDNNHLRENVTLDVRGQLAVNTRERKPSPDAKTLIADSLIGLIGAALCTAITFDLLPVRLIGGWNFLWFLAGLGMMLGSLYLFASLFYTTERFNIPSPIDQQTIQTLDRFKGSDPEVTRDLLSIASSSRKLTQAEASFEVARERIELAGASEPLLGELARAQAEVDQVSGERAKLLGRLIAFASTQERPSSK